MCPVDSRLHKGILLLSFRHRHLKGLLTTILHIGPLIDRTITSWIRLDSAQNAKIIITDADQARDLTNKVALHKPIAHGHKVGVWISATSLYNARSGVNIGNDRSLTTEGAASTEKCLGHRTVSWT